ncbi:MAG: hypothetical protein LBU31_01310 [Coriobacteriales bacterium]|jgi:hydroxymethylpyrimidine pyrophosphatase-like HAD family hydrolase|nr:hypothetical protein [Coriobacteriales bacterium]
MKQQTMISIIVLLIGAILIALAFNFDQRNDLLYSLGLLIIGLGLDIFRPIIKSIRLACRSRKVSENYHPRVIPVADKPDKPRLILSDIDGCITPPLRQEVDPYQLAKLRAYCEFAAKNRDYPQICFFTGRNQGYVELLAQALGMTEQGADIPFVIENGGALYYPQKKVTEKRISDEQVELVNKARVALSKQLPENEFEVKNFMVTINPTPNQGSPDLKERIDTILKSENLNKQLRTADTASSVDVSPLGISKDILMDEVVEGSVEGSDLNDKWRKVIALGDQYADKIVLEKAAKAFCPIDSSQKLKICFDPPIGSPLKGRIVDKPHIEAVLEVIEGECGLKIV